MSRVREEVGPTQLGRDRDSDLVANLFDECDPAVKMLLAMAIFAANKARKYIQKTRKAGSDPGLFCSR